MDASEKLLQTGEERETTSYMIDKFLISGCGIMATVLLVSASGPRTKGIVNAALGLRERGVCFSDLCQGNGPLQLSCSVVLSKEALLSIVPENSFDDDGRLC